ncbi:MAG TPA: hypothetical protein PLU22_15430 [Polyangiaceae bacterium]|nr:hypothetical protein [Polyangiaceae bacterium]
MSNATSPETTAATPGSHPAPALPRQLGPFRCLTTLLALVSVAGSALADEPVVGHMTPLPEELLPTPVVLDCGATIREVRGGSPDMARLNRLCTHAFSNFFTFIRDLRHLEVTREDDFDWNVSFLPEARCYRCLNDERHRFRYRFVRGALIGYTDRDLAYIFMISDPNDREFRVTFVHELFHAMSMFYGIFDRHPGDWTEQAAADDRLAADFTAWLGYGR